MAEQRKPTIEELKQKQEEIENGTGGFSGGGDLLEETNLKGKVITFVSSGIELTRAKLRKEPVQEKLPGLE